MRRRCIVRSSRPLRAEVVTRLGPLKQRFPEIRCSDEEQRKARRVPLTRGARGRLDGVEGLTHLA
jgi:hypothetical protein